MSLSLYRIPDGQQKGQSKVPCPSVHAPASALRSLSSVALSSAPASKTLTAPSSVTLMPRRYSQTFSSTFSNEATNLISSTFLHEAIGSFKAAFSCIVGSFCCPQAGCNERFAPGVCRAGPQLSTVCMTRLSFGNERARIIFIRHI